MERLNVRAVAMLLLVSVPAVASDRGLFVAPGAVEVARRPGKSTASVQYYVKEPYPATGTLAFLQKSLAERGWHPVTRADLGRYERSSLESGWLDLPGERTSVLMRVWSARWLDSRGNEVIHTLSYGSSLAEDGLQPTHVAVAGWYHNNKEAARLKAARDREVERLTRILPKSAVQPPAEPCRE